MTLPTGTQALVIVTAQAFASTGSTGSFMSVAVTGGAAAKDEDSYRVFNNDPVRASAVSLITGLSRWIPRVLRRVQEPVPGRDRHVDVLGENDHRDSVIAVTS